MALELVAREQGSMEFTEPTPTGPNPTPPDDPLWNKRRTADNQGNSSHELKLTREQSLARVMSENQQEEVPEIQAWNVETGPWRGRLGTSLEANTRGTVPLTR